MENNAPKTSCTVEESYRKLHTSVFQYIYYKIDNREDAEDLSQDVFVRLMEYKQMLCESTVKSFIYTIARNLVTDYLRHHYKRQEVSSYIFESSVTYTNETEQKVIADDLAAHEQYRMQLLPPQRRTIYQMSRFEGKSNMDISQELNLSLRTIENHLFIGRKEIREYMRQCM